MSMAPSTRDGTVNTSANIDDNLDAFFRRPVKIFSDIWTVNNLYFETINPWTRFFSNPRVINRICNYRLLRANLHVKIVLNGNPFYYGRMLVSYQPLSDYDDMTRNRAPIYQDLISASQRQHILLDPTTSSGGEMLLPFYYPSNYVSIPNSGWSELGTLNLRDLNLLNHANAITGTVGIQIFAWAEDVELSVLTGVSPDSLVPQAGDEYDSGPISGPASAVTAAAGKLTTIPVIGKYARATEMAAKGVADVAHAFGYSKPNVVETAPRTTLVPINYSNSNVSDPITKLSLDAKAEMSIDPSLTGVSYGDEWEIKSIAKRESLITTATWATTDSTEKLLFTAVVDPMLTDALDIGAELHLTPMAYAALPFRFWKGTLKYRFQVVASAMHRGRLKVVYEPYGFAGFVPSTEYNTNYTHIVDISETREFTIDVGWGSPETYREVGPLALDTSALHYAINGSVTTWTANAAWGNGLINLFVVNELTTPSDVTGTVVYVNVFVSAGDDFEVAVPVANPLAQLTFTPPPDPNRMVPQSGDSAVDDVEENIVTPAPRAPENNLVYFGESITSFRQLTKRYTLAEVATMIVAANKVYQVKGNTMPDVSIYSGTDQIAQTNFLTYSMVPFLGWRGSIKRRVISLADAVGSTGLVMSRSPGHVAGFVFTDYDLTGAPSDLILAYQDNFLGGVTIADTTTNNQPIEAEFPFYSNYRFDMAKSYSPQVFSSETFTMSFQVTTPPVGILYFAFLVSAGEDFTVSNFQSIPIMWVKT